MRNRLVYLLKTYLWTMLVFIIGKIVFLLCNMTSHSFTIGDVVDVIWHGMPLDLSVAFISSACHYCWSSLAYGLIFLVLSY